MGSAQRSQRRRQQQRSTKAVAAARGSTMGRGKIIVGVVVIVALAAAIIAGVLITNSKRQAQQNAAIPAVPAKAEYPTRVVDGAVVLAGKDSASIKIDMYEDFICPACGQFFTASHTDMENALANGQIQARIHMLNFLDNNSRPPGYSMRAANASLVAAAQGKFADYYNSLYSAQPKEGSAGYTDAQLANLGERLGIGGSFADEVNAGKYNGLIQADFAQAQTVVGGFYGKTYGPDFQHFFATPTVMYQGKALDVTPRQNQVTGAVMPSPWLQDLIAGKVDVAPRPQS